MKTHNYLLNARISLKLLLTLLVSFVFFLRTASSQTIGTYQFAIATPGYALLSGATSVPSGDDVISTALPIGFTFNFGGTNFTQFKMNSNGWMTFNTAVTSTTNNNALNSAMATQVIAAFNRNLVTASMSYLLTGTAPNRILKIQWDGTVAPGALALPGMGSFQVWLFETSNVIDVRYGVIGASGNHVNSVVVQVGLKGASTGTTDIRAVVGATWPTATVSNLSSDQMDVTLAILPTDGMRYRFTPITPCSGTPAPGNTQSSMSTSCPGSTFTLSLQNQTSGSGVTYQWQSGASSSGPWNNFGPDANTATVTMGATTTWYRCVVSCAGSPGNSTPVQVIVGDCCNYTFRLRDDFGDGWNGALMQVRIGTTVVATLGTTFTSGTPFDEVVPLMNGITYNLYYLNDGNYPSEVGIRVFDNNGTSIHNTGFGAGTVGTTLFTWTASCPVPCSGIPVPGNTLSNLNYACTTDVFTLSLQNQFNLSGITYQWQSSPNNSTWTNISGATLETYDGSQTAATWYRCRVTCSGGTPGNSTSKQILQTLCYCESAATDNPDDDIFNVTLNTLNNSSTCNTVAPGAGSVRSKYANYTTLSPTSLTQGTSYPMSLTLGYCNGSSYETSAAVFIDFNQNGTFDAVERVYNSPYLQYAVSGTVVSGTVLVPNCAVTGITRMRIVMDEFNNAPSACGTYTWGETEDYMVNIVAAPIVNPVASNISGALTGICNTSLSYSVAPGYSGSIQWQTATVAGGPYTDFAGATGTTQSFTPPAPGTYYLRVRFIGQGCVTDAVSNVLTIIVNSPSISVTTPSSSNICRGTSVALTANGAGPYSWNNGATTQTINVAPLVNTTFIVAAGTGQCSSTGSIAINIIGGPVASPTITPSGVRCPGTALRLRSNLIANADIVNTFNGGSLTIPILSGAANPYPSSINVSGLTASSVIANVKINGLTHSFASDVDIVLQSPNGTNVLLLADNGGTNSISNVSLTLQDGAAALPGNLTTGTYRTTTNTSWSGTVVAAPFGTTLSAFTGSLNGAWKLYVYDDAILDGGSINSWSITFSTPSAPFTYSGTVTYSWTGTNGFTSNAVNPFDSPLVTTTYTLTVADNVCSSTSQITRAVLPAPSVTTSTGSPFCENSSVDFTTTGSGAITSGSLGTLSVIVSGVSNLDEVSWTVRSSSNATIASGGNYAFGSTNTIAVSPAASDYPVTFTIETQGAFGDNEIDYEVVCSIGSATLVSGHLDGDMIFASAPLNCGSPLGGLLYSWSGPNGFTSSLEDPSIPNAQAAESGDYTVTITDGNGCMTSSTTNVIVNDNPEPYLVYVNPMSCDNANDGSFQVFVNGGTPFFSYFDINLGQSFTGGYSGVPAGTYYIEVSDLNQCFSVTPVEVVVLQAPNAAPVITCPANITTNNTTGLCGAQIIYNMPAVTDACPVGATLQTSGLPSGMVFPVGTTSNSYTVTDDHGLSASCAFTVTVVDNIQPAFSSPASNLVVQCNGSGNTAALNTWLGNHGNATASDECGSVTWGHNYSGLTSSCGATGSATVTFTATDTHGNSASSIASFTIVDSTPPAITASSDQSAECDGAGNIASRNAWLANHGGATASDACSGVAWSDNFNGITSACGSTGSATVTFTATDACGNASSTTSTFTIVDTDAPSLVCPANIVVSNDLNQCGAIVNYNASASDVCSGSATVGYSIAPGTFFNIGTTSVNVTATDACGNTTLCSFTVKVEDTQLPEITCASNIVGVNDPGVCGAAKTFAVSYADNCTGASMIQTAGLPSGSVFPVGTTVNTFVATDASGNSKSCSFSVSISDVEDPTILNCPANFSSCNPISWTPPIISDNCPGVQISSSHVPGTNFLAGTTLVTYTAIDAYNNSSTCSFNVTRLEESVAATSITSNRDFNNICAGDNITLTINGGSLGQAGVWKWYSGSCVGTPLPAFNGMTSITVSPTSTTTYFARAEGLCNVTGCVSIQVVVSTLAPGSVTITSMPPYGAVGVTGVITCSPVAGATFYRWTSNLGHINAVWFNGQQGPVETAANSVNVSFQLALQNYQIRVVAGNACGRSSNASAHIRGTVPASTCLSGPILACPNTNATYSVAACPISGTNTYQWAVTGNATITSGQGTSTITVHFNAGFTNATVCVNGITNFGLAGPQTCLNVSNTTAAPGAITGNDKPCSSSIQSYSVTAVAGASSYIWTTNIAGATVTGSSTTGTVTFPAGSFNGQVCVQAVSSCGTSVASCFAITSGVPGIPGPISGPASGICGASNVNYALGTNDANSYNWILPTGVSLVSGGSSNSVNVSFATGLTAPLTITVQAFYNCGSATSSIVVTGTPSAPSITPATICPGEEQLYFASAIGSGLTFNWITTGEDYAYCTNPSCSQFNIGWSTNGGTIAVTASNSCGTSPAFNLSTNCRISVTGEMDTRVYPNPTDGNLTVEFNSYSGGQYNLTISDMAGRLIMSQDIKATSGINQHTLDLSYAKPGLYMLYLRDAQGKITVTKVTVE